MSDKSILIIEDDDEIRKACVRKLGDEFPGYEIKVAGNYVAGMRMVNADTSISAVITDNHMPRSGSDQPNFWAKAICTNISMGDKKIPVYVYSSEVSPADRQAIVNSGAYVSNGKDAAELNKIITALREKLAHPDATIKKGAAR